MSEIVRLEYLEQQFQVLANEMNTALAEVQKTTELLTQLLLAGTKAQDARITALEKQLGISSTPLADASEKNK